MDASALIAVDAQAAGVREGVERCCEEVERGCKEGIEKGLRGVLERVEFVVEKAAGIWDGLVLVGDVERICE